MPRLCGMLAVFGLLLPTIANAQSPKPTEPKRFVPPVHAKPMPGNTGQPQANQQAAQPIPNNPIRQVSAVQDFDNPNQQWRQRQTTNASQTFSLSDNDDPAPSLNGNRSVQPSLSAPDQVQRPNGNYGHSVLVNPSKNSDGAQQTPAENQLRMDPVRRSPQAVSSNYSTGAPKRDSFSFQDQELPQGNRGVRSCDYYREELLNTPISDIVLDISPLKPKNTGPRTPVPNTHQWTDCWGELLGTGALVGLSRSYIVVEDAEGNRDQIATTWLSDGDWEIIARLWDVPIECNLGCYRFEGRSWLPNCVTWNASALCHKPLYTQDIQLERYGHTHGPVMQPIRSTAHFFVSVLTVPYQYGIHPPNECLYALGFYRPGNCAPWLKDPLPISLRGSLYQAGFVTGALYATP